MKSKGTAAWTVSQRMGHVRDFHSPGSITVFQDYAVTDITVLKLNCVFKRMYSSQIFLSGFLSKMARFSDLIKSHCPTYVKMMHGKQHGLAGKQSRSSGVWQMLVLVLWRFCSLQHREWGWNRWAQDVSKGESAEFEKLERWLGQNLRTTNTSGMVEEAEELANETQGHGSNPKHGGKPEEFRVTDAMTRKCFQKEDSALCQMTKDTAEKNGRQMQ